MTPAVFILLAMIPISALASLGIYHFLVRRGVRLIFLSLAKGNPVERE